mmetsp:Transcript_15347/g.32205  ORF Transcript_15347/g.32205 Transcript_15347/m.32205 type:complete len:660 (-) Transcript_15347:286-2265(-)
MVSPVGMLTAVLSGCTFPLQSNALLTSSFVYSKGVQTSSTSTTRNRILRHSLPLSFISQQRRGTLISLDAVSEKTRTNEESTDLFSTDTPPNASTNSPPQLTVIAGPGAKITSVSQGVSVEQELFDDWEDCWDGGSDSAASNTSNTPNLTLVAGNRSRMTPVSLGVEVGHQKLHRLQHREARDGESELSSHSSQIRNKVNESVETNEEHETDELDDAGNNDEDEVTESDEEDSNSAARETLVKAVILRRAGIVGGNAKKSTGSNGRSTLAKKHVVKNARHSSRGSGVRPLSQVLSTMRTAAAAAAGQPTDLLDTGIPLESSDGRKSEQSDQNSVSEAMISLTSSKKTGNRSKSSWKAAIDSTVANVIRNQSIQRNQYFNNENVFIPHSSISTVTPPPPGSTTMGILGEVVQDKLPDVRPLPGQVLVDESKDPDSSSKHRKITVRSSIPHSSDDISIANLRLSVFSNFDEDMQQQFRHRSLEVLNVRRKLGAVALVAEVPSHDGDLRQIEFRNDLHSRVEQGCRFGSVDSACLNPYSAKKHFLDDKENTTPRKSNNDKMSNWIIGSVECSHHEFRGTMLGNSRPKGSLMYVTEVAVCPEARRCGAGAMLMKVKMMLRCFKKLSFFSMVNFCPTILSHDSGSRRSRSNSRCRDSLPSRGCY